MSRCCWQRRKRRHTRSWCPCRWVRWTSRAGRRRSMSCKPARSAISSEGRRFVAWRRFLSFWVRLRLKLAFLLQAQNPLSRWKVRKTAKLKRIKEEDAKFSGCRFLFFGANQAGKRKSRENYICTRSLDKSRSQRAEEEEDRSPCPRPGTELFKVWRANFASLRRRRSVCNSARIVADWSCEAL